MDRIIPVDVHNYTLDVGRDLTVTFRERKPGPPQRIDGMTLGIVSMSGEAPHGGEVHPDGDEVLYVIQGRLRVTGDSDPATPIELGPGEACIVRKGEWHRVEALEATQLVHLTPGPGGDHRPR